MNILWEKEKIIDVLNDEYVLADKGKVFVVPTDKLPQLKEECRRGRKKPGMIPARVWEDETVRIITNGKNRSNIAKEDAIHFSYIKYAFDKDSKKIFGIIGGKSLFYGHTRDTSDVNVCGAKAPIQAEHILQENNLEWYTRDIIILVNNNPKEEKANADEKWIQDRFGLFTSQNLNTQKGI